MKPECRPNIGINPALMTIVIAALYCVVPQAQAGGLPVGGTFVGGHGSIAQAGSSLTINQTSARGVIDWNSFSIANGNHVIFNNGNGATLNRVIGGNPSSIYGSLSATGSLYLINPQGIVVGASGVISTGGRFVASTLNTDDTAFMIGGPLTFSGSSKARVINLGEIGSTGGDVFLIAHNAVENRGAISAPNGTAELAVGQQVLLQDSSSTQQVFVQTGSGGSITNNGAIKAAQINLQASDGNVFALAGNHEVLRATGTSTRDGHVWLVADTGKVEITGQIEAANANGSGGTVDTTAGTLSLPRSGSTVHAGAWNIATPAFKIDSLAAGALTRSLDAGTSVNLQTTGANSAVGDLDVAANMGWNGAASLTLGAFHTVTVGNGVTIANQGSGNLTLRADASAIDNGGSVINNGKLDWSKSTGIVSALYDMTGSYTPGTWLGNSAWTAAPYSGLVTQFTAYKLVNSLTDWQNVSLDLAGNYALGANIDASVTSTLHGYTPIGTSANPFTGQFDGMGHTVDRLSFQYIGSPTSPVGLFGTIGKTGVVRNVGVTNSETNPGASISMFNCPASGCTVGVLAGDNQGVIANAYTTGGMTDNPPSVSLIFGGLVGQNEGLIERSWSGVNSGDSLVVGGLAGINSGTIVQSYATGQMWANGAHTAVGGLVGINSGNISQSYAAGYAFANSSDNGVGGLVGNNSGNISQSFASVWMLPSNSTPRGIAGTNSGSISPDVYWNVDLSGAPNGGPGVPSSNGLNTAQMANPASFSGWDFSPTGVWAMPAGAAHPVLAWQAGSQ